MTSPLEQFSVIKIIPIGFQFIDLSVTNSAIYCLLTLGCLKFIWSIIEIDGLLVVPNFYQVVCESIFDFVQNLTKEQLGPNAKSYFPIVFSAFLFILISNLIGLIPFSFATTAQLVIAFTLSFSLFIGVTIIGIKTHGIKFLSFFLPSGAPIFLAPLLVGIELISYVFRPISLGVRLFANMTAGHSLLAIIAGFALSIGSLASIMAIAAIIPMAVIVVIFALELAVALLQAYVFAVLFCIYLKDAIELH
jgi:ATP synthase subunit 6